jgi:hypothetical protein
LGERGERRRVFLEGISSPFEEEAGDPSEGARAILLT